MSEHRPEHQAVVGRTIDESTPWHPDRPRPAGAPNVVVVMLDDVGFAQLGPFGSDISTPTLDALAADGLRYNRFHATAICSPSRAAMLTGRNHHAVGMGFLVDLPTGFPGYTARIPRSAASLARVLRDEGWSTMAVGKWHLTPRNDRSAAGPFDTWPLAMGFERFYGFLHGDANQWTPSLVRDNTPIEPPASPEDGYHLTDDLTDQALRMVRDQKNAAPEKPFFLYYAPGTAHAPHQVPQAWSQAYAGAFDDGWEAARDRAFQRQIDDHIIPADTPLPPRPPWVPAWDELPAEQQRLFARFQEVFAGFITHFDAQLGRLMEGLREMGLSENTLVVVTSDNGASAEGGEIGSLNEHRFGFGVPDVMADNLAAIDDLGGFHAYNHYPWGWAWAGNAPFRLWKRYTWLGGTRVPLIIRPPGGVEDPGGVRSQITHMIDLFPTILDVCGVEAPKVVDGVVQQPVDGRSMRASFSDAEVEVRRTQYFEMMGSRSIIHDGWKATTDHVSEGVPDEERLMPGSRRFEDDTWSLFRLDDDFCESHDVAQEHPEIVAALEQQWWAEAERNQVLPLQDGLQGRVMALEPTLWPAPDELVLYPHSSPVADEAVPSLAGGAVLEVDVEVPDGGGQGILAAMGDWSNGWALAVLEGCPAFLLNLTSTPYAVRCTTRLDPGAHTIGFRFDPADGGRGILTCDGAVVGAGALPRGLGASGLQIGGGGMRLGHDAGFPVSADYAVPFAWTGTLHRARFRALSVSTPVDQAELLEALLRSE
ncbi:MAG: arylsulfatase [Nocardioides sp.]